MMLMCNACGEEHDGPESEIGTKCGRDLTPEINENEDLNLILPDRYVICPGIFGEAPGYD